MDYFGLGTGELLALTSAFIWGIGSVIYGIIDKKINSFVINLLSTIPAFIFQLSLIVVFGDLTKLYITDIRLLVILISTAIIVTLVGITLFIESLKLSGVSIAVPVSSIMPLFTLFLALIFLGEVITPLIVLGTVAVIAGISLLNIQKSGDKTKRKNVRKGIIYAIISAFSWSVSGLLITKFVLIELDPLYINTFRTGVQIIFLFVLISTLQKDAFNGILKIRKSQHLAMGVGGILNKSVGLILFLTSIQYIGLSLSTVISCTYPLFAFVLAIVFLKEEITRFKLIGISAIVSGTILLTL